MAEQVKIDADYYVMPDGSRHLVYWDIPLEWFSDERGPAAMQLAEQRALAKLEGRKLEN